LGVTSGVSETLVIEGAAKVFSRARDISCVGTHRVVVVSSTGLSVLATAPDSFHDIAIPARAATSSTLAASLAGCATRVPFTPVVAYTATTITVAPPATATAFATTTARASNGAAPPVSASSIVEGTALLAHEQEPTNHPWVINRLVCFVLSDSAEGRLKDGVRVLGGKNFRRGKFLADD